MGRGLEGVDPFSSSGGAVYRDGSLGTVSSHPLTEGLTSLTSDGLWGGVAALGGTTVVASWNDRTPRIAGWVQEALGRPTHGRREHIPCAFHDVVRAA